jgi:hypothetical protein
MRHLQIHTLILIIQVRITSVPFFVCSNLSHRQGRPSLFLFVPTYLTDKVDPQSSLTGQVLLIYVTPLDTKFFLIKGIIVLYQS